MGNAARKARKAAGVKFVHPTKEPTPLPMRRGAPRRQVMQHMDAAIKAGIQQGSMPEWARPEEPAEYLTTNPTSTPKKNTKRTTGKSNIEVVPSGAELDPKPYRVGRKRYSRDEAIAAGGFPNDYILSPRKGYNQDESIY